MKLLKNEEYNYYICLKERYKSLKAENNMLFNLYMDTLETNNKLITKNNKLLKNKKTITFLEILNKLNNGESVCFKDSEGRYNDILTKMVGKVHRIEDLKTLLNEKYELIEEESDE